MPRGRALGIPILRGSVYTILRHLYITIFGHPAGGGRGARSGEREQGDREAHKKMGEMKMKKRDGSSGDALRNCHFAGNA